MRYGYFDDENREYVISDPKTPVKWINYVGSLAFGGIVDHTGGAVICRGDPALNRITKYIPQLPNRVQRADAVPAVQTGGYRSFLPSSSPHWTPTISTNVTSGWATPVCLRGYGIGSR